MKQQQLYSLLRQAIDKYSMIEEGDKIAVGLSGGKDSLTLLYGLSGLKKFYPHKFDIVAICVDLGYPGFDTTQMENYCKSLEVDCYIVHTKINEILKSGECSLCARLRKGAFNEKALELRCNKIAYAHNMDDVVETLMLSLMYEGRFSTFWPVTAYEDTGLTLIRPMIFVPKNMVTGFCNKYNIVVTKNPCPYDKTTQRTYIRSLLKEMELHAPGTKKRMMRAIMCGISNWV